MRWHRLADAAFLLLLVAYVLSARRYVPFHGDEPGLMALSADLFMIANQDNPGEIQFSGEIDRTDRYQRERIATGAVTPLLLGMTFYFSGVTQDELPGFWKWGGELPAQMDRFDFNVSQGNLPGDHLLLLARTPPTVLFALSIVLVFLITMRLTSNRPASYASSLLYGTTPALLLNGTRALQEGAMLFFGTLSILLCLRAVDSETTTGASRAPKAFSYLALGGAAGVALASKHTNAMVLAALLGAIVVVPWLSPRQMWRDLRRVVWEPVLKASIVGFTSLAVFFVLSPSWWSWERIVGFAGLSIGAFLLLWGPRQARRRFLLGLAALSLTGGGFILVTQWPEIVRPFSVMVEVRQRLMISQAESSGGIYGRLNRGFFLIEQAFFGPPQYFETSDWGEYPTIREQIDTFEATLFDGLPPSIPLGVALMGLSALGGWVVLRQRDHRAALLVLFWLAIPALVLFIANPLPWQRYYIGLQPPLAVLVGVGFARLGESVAETVRARRLRIAPG